MTFEPHPNVASGPVWPATLVRYCTAVPAGVVTLSPGGQSPRRAGRRRLGHLRRLGGHLDSPIAQPLSSAEGASARCVFSADASFVTRQKRPFFIY